MLINTNEELVRTRIEELLKDYNCCKCEKCVNDMIAVALNHMKPSYVNTAEGVLIKRAANMNTQRSADVDIEIIKAIELVSSNPQH